MNRGEIWDVDLPLRSGGKGHEQTGFRPAVIVNVQPDPNNPLVVIALFTTNLTVLRFPHTLRVEPSQTNGLTKPSVLMIYQITALDRHRFVRQRGTLEADSMDQVDEKLRTLLGI